MLYSIDIMTYFFVNIQPEKTNMKKKKINNNSIQPTTIKLHE